MLSEYLNTLKVSTINRIIQRSFVVVISSFVFYKNVPTYQTLLLCNSMLSEYRHTLRLSIINRIIQRSFVVGIYLTSIDVVITQELRHDVVMVVVCCTVQCGAVTPVIHDIQINPRMVHQHNHHTQLVVECCSHQSCVPVLVAGNPVVYPGENSLEEHSSVQGIVPVPIDFIGVIPAPPNRVAVQQWSRGMAVVHDQVEESGGGETQAGVGGSEVTKSGLLPRPSCRVMLCPYTPASRPKSCPPLYSCMNRA